MRRLAGTVALAIVLAGAAFAHGDLHGQIEGATAQIRQRPDDAALYLKRAELYRLHGEPTLSAADYDRSARLDPGLAGVHLGRGKLLLETGQPADAARELDLYLDRHPRHVEALVTRARANAQRGNPSAAASDYASAIRHSPTPEPEHYLEYARVLASNGGEGPEAALAAVDAGMAKLGPLPVLGLYAVDLLVERARFDEALARVEILGAGAARREPWLERRGDILALAGREAQAREAWSAALAAIAALPAHIRGNRATAEREARLRGRLAKAR